MDELFLQFLKEKRYVANLAEGTLNYYREVYNFFKAAGFDGSKESVQNAVIAFRERGTSSAGSCEEGYVHRRLLESLLVRHLHHLLPAFEESSSPGAC